MPLPQYDPSFVGFPFGGGNPSQYSSILSALTGGGGGNSGLNPGGGDTSGGSGGFDGAAPGTGANDPGYGSGSMGTAGGFHAGYGPGYASAGYGPVSLGIGPSGIGPSVDFGLGPGNAAANTAAKAGLHAAGVPTGYAFPGMGATSLIGMFTTAMRGVDALAQSQGVNTISSLANQQGPISEAAIANAIAAMQGLQPMTPEGLQAFARMSFPGEGRPGMYSSPLGYIGYQSGYGPNAGLPGSGISTPFGWGPNVTPADLSLGPRGLFGYGARTGHVDPNEEGLAAAIASAIAQAENDASSPGSSSGGTGASPGPSGDTGGQGEGGAGGGPGGGDSGD